MNDVVKREPVDNSHRDAGIAARDARKEAEKTAVVAEAVEAAEDAVEDEAEAGETQNEPEASAAAESGDAPAQQPRKKKPGVHERIDELTRNFRTAERDRDYWREQAMRQGQAPAQGQPEQPQAAQAALPDSAEPTLESCDFDPALLQRRWYEWRRNEDRKQEQAEAKQRKFNESEAAFRAEHPDYDAVTRDPSLPITKAMADEIADTDNPPAIAYYLGQNPNEAAAIAQMTERQMARAIGRIEAKLSAPIATQPDQPRQPEPKTVTRAPAPVTTLSGAPAVKKTYEGMSMKEYDEARRKERAAKGLSNR